MRSERQKQLDKSYAIDYGEFKQIFSFDIKDEKDANGQWVEWRDKLDKERDDIYKREDIQSLIFMGFIALVWIGAIMNAILAGEIGHAVMIILITAVIVILTVFAFIFGTGE